MFQALVFTCDSKYCYSAS